MNFCTAFNNLNNLAGKYHDRHSVSVASEQSVVGLCNPSYPWLHYEFARQLNKLTWQHENLVDWHNTKVSRNLLGTLKLGRSFGIDVLLHWSFFLLPLLVIWLSYQQGDTLQLMALRMVFLIVILASVLIHEIGHALGARWFDIPTRDIMLTPICGLARLDRQPDTPLQEIIVAFAGPLANLLVAGILAGTIVVLGGSLGWTYDLFGSNLLTAVFWVNVLLFLLNLLPIFPMDGGRIFRALIATRLGPATATRFAARLGQVASLTLACYGAFIRNYALVVIGVFLILAAAEELKNLRRVTATDSARQDRF